MSKYRAPYAPEFRQQTVDPVRAEELSKEFGPSTPTIYGWVAHADRDTPHTAQRCHVDGPTTQDCRGRVFAPTANGFWASSVKRCYASKR